MQEQNFKNHARFVPLYHYVTFTLILAVIIGSVLKLYRSYTTGLHGLLVPVILCLVSVILLLLAWFARSFALAAQDRAIRAEENLRYFSITGKLLDKKLSKGQIIALRFAPDEEFVELTNRAVKEDMKPVDIKKSIKNWKADHNRA